MDELRVPADRDDLGAFLDELVVPLCQSGELGRSDEGEIRRIEEQHRPCPGLPAVRQAHRAEISPGSIKRFEFEIRDFFAYLNAATGF
jgi:hypothetical protein